MKIRSAVSVIAVALFAIAAVAATRTALVPATTQLLAIPSIPQVATEATDKVADSPSENAASAAEKGPEIAALPVVVACGCESTVAQLAALLAEQQAAVENLLTVSAALTEAYEQVHASLEQVHPTPDWHNRMVANNRERYQAIRGTLTSLTEEQLPTERTWYGRQWKSLTLPFRVGRFPTAAERDQLLMLLDELGELSQREPACQRLCDQLGALDYGE